MQISITPLNVMYWNRSAIRLFHDLAPHDIISWDATGKIVKSQISKKKLLYYELTARHPKSNKISTPLSIMVSDTHTQPVVTNWLATFRHHEKMIYGSNNLCRPVQFNSDRALVLILASLDVINKESLLDYFKRAWRITHGQATLEELMKMNFHACAFHFIQI